MDQSTEHSLSIFCLPALCLPLCSLPEAEAGPTHLSLFACLQFKLPYKFICIQCLQACHEPILSCPCLRVQFKPLYESIGTSLQARSPESFCLVSEGVYWAGYTWHIKIHTAIKVWGEGRCNRNPAEGRFESRAQLKRLWA